MQGNEHTLSVPLKDSSASTQAVPMGKLRTAAALIAKMSRGIVRPADERARTQRDALFAFAVRVISAAILYLSQVVLARWMGSFEYGIYVSVWTWVLVLGGLSAMGLGNGSLRLQSEYRESGEHGLALGLIRGGRAAALVSGTVVAALGCAGLWAFGSYMEPVYILPAYLALVCLPLYALTDVQDGIARGRGWMATGVVPPFILRPLFILAGVAFAHEAGFPMRATTAAAAAITGVWLAALVQSAMIGSWLRREGRTEKRRYAFATWFKNSLPLVAVYACELVIQNADIIIIAHALTPADVGVYFASAKTMSLIMFVQYAVGSSIAARFAALSARGDQLALKAFVGDAANWTFWPSLAGAVVILLLGKPLLSLFGPEFAAGYPLMFILVLGLLFRSAMGPADILLNMLGQQKLCAILLAATAVLDVVLNLALVPRYGLVGAATATSLALAFGALMSYTAARKRLGLDVAIWHNLKRT